MGTSFLPVAAGHQLAGWLSGGVFERISDKHYLLGLELSQRGISLPAVSDIFSKNEFWQEAAVRLEMSSSEPDLSVEQLPSLADLVSLQRNCSHSRCSPLDLRPLDSEETVTSTPLPIILTSTSTSSGTAALAEVAALTLVCCFPGNGNDRIFHDAHIAHDKSFRTQFQVRIEHLFERNFFSGIR